MKTLLFALMMFVAVGVNSQNVVRNMTIYNINGFVDDCLKELGVDSTMINIQTVDGLIFSKYEAICKKTDCLYTVAVSNTLFYDGVLKSVAHELIHVKQYTSGKLKILGNGNIEFGILAIRTTNDSHYNDPQEVEARVLGLQLYEKFKTSYLYK